MGLKLSSSKKKHKLYIYIYHRSSGIRQIINNLFYVAFSCQKPRSISPHSQNKHIARASTSESSMQLFHQAEVKFITSVTWHERKAESLHTHGSQLSPIETATRTKSNKLQQYHCMFVPETSRSTVIGSIRHTNRQEQKAGRQLLHKGMGG